MRLCYVEIRRQYARWYIWHATTLHGGIILVPICKINVKWCLGQQFSWTSLHSSEQLFLLLLKQWNKSIVTPCYVLHAVSKIWKEYVQKPNVISRIINVFDVEYERRTGYGRYKNLLFPQISLYFNEMKTDPEQLSLPVFLFLMLKMCVFFILFICLFIYIFFYYTIFGAFRKQQDIIPFFSF